MALINPEIHKKIKKGVVIPAHPLALTEKRTLDERRQRALTRYYLSAGAGGLAIGVHTTQFEIHDEKIGLYKPVLQLGAETISDCEESYSINLPVVRIAGVIGKTSQAVKEASLAKDLGYHAVLLSMAAFKDSTNDEMIEHVKKVAEIMPVFGFYLQTAAGGRILNYDFWRKFSEIENVVAIKIAPFNRYQTIDVIRAVADSGRDIALYTGNDDNIISDLLTAFVFSGRTNRIVGGLLGHWACWTKKAVEILEKIHLAVMKEDIPQTLISLNSQVTDCNAAIFDAANNFAGCIPGVHEILRRQGLLGGVWTLNPKETISPGQIEEIDRIYRAYPHLNDDEFVLKNKDKWLE
ncbi:MAG TPA: dihydrodipicolinate synthase family protein [Candidatus Ratteibacteria bacterium]|jgi:dihydrodipicolinate synthase/N-acetylneuraminate lyase|uniref:Dihydrodipicolinate synthase n=1 Tax=candidate division TA06 bacterium ADurb.Bin131 TaxID=1852827 RepID=A0A1V6C997_UNCT6|nr:MAG: dihydrodipicolinate synthase [candidate division TA06 bacterium ADurb.Bin131]HOC03073.1 dihydrodipicolinate synthase family protein [bacterium]HRS05694.1 dihydrodipicolinate synthase family protein [Candidatus Ratteibacteria bacterium]HON05121.1 dihydrodipicolinate synthase family protein [bacterium]HPC28737.1 dihydrodipicolinate synthase family protein [bacterium]